MNGYKAFYCGKSIEIYAESLMGRGNRRRSPRSR